MPSKNVTMIAFVFGHVLLEDSSLVFYVTWLKFAPFYDGIIISEDITLIKMHPEFYRSESEELEIYSEFSTI